MDVLIRTLAQARQAEANLKAELRRVDSDAVALIQERFGDQLDSINVKLSEAQALTKSAESAVRNVALSSYVADGNKHPHAAVTVKVYKRLDYDPETAFTYCTHHLTVALKMDKRKFEKVAKAAGLDFVDTVDEPRATIARRLSDYL